MSPRQPWTPLAVEALKHMADGHDQAAIDTVKRIHDRYGADAVPEVMIAWVDTVLAVLPGDVTQSARNGIGLAFMNIDSGDVTGADEVPPAVRWAGRFLVARAAFDRDQAEALLGSFTTEQEYGRAVFALLDTCAGVLRTAGRL